MSPRLEHFLQENRILLGTDWQELRGWSEETAKAKFARREVPKFHKIGNLKIITYEDAAEYLLEHAQDKAKSDAGKTAATVDLLGLSKAK